MKRRPHHDLLTELLAALVKEYGQQEVFRSLEKIAVKSEDKVRSADGIRTKERPRRPLAIEQVNRANPSPEKRPILEDIARRYESKEFLPTVADTREFLIMMGLRPGALKDRSDAFRPVLETISKLPLDHLNELAKSTRHSGPSRLGPISDAIALAGASLASRRQPQDG